MPDSENARTPAIVTRRADTADVAIVARFVHALLDELSGGMAPSLGVVSRSAQAVIADASVVAVIAGVDEEPGGIMVPNECAAIHAGGKFGEITEPSVTRCQIAGYRGLSHWCRTGARTRARLEAA